MLGEDADVRIVFVEPAELIAQGGYEVAGAGGVEDSLVGGLGGLAAGGFESARYRGLDVGGLDRQNQIVDWAGTPIHGEVNRRWHGLSHEASNVTWGARSARRASVNRCRPSPPLKLTRLA